MLNVTDANNRASSRNIAIVPTQANVTQTARCYFKSATRAGNTTEAVIVTRIDNIAGMVGYRFGVNVTSQAQYKNGSIVRMLTGGDGVENENFANGFLANYAYLYEQTGSFDILSFRVIVPAGVTSVSLNYTSKSRINDGAIPCAFENATLQIQ